MERRRAGLATDRRLWLLLDEYSHDVLETLFYFNPSERLGTFGAAFPRKALAAFADTVTPRKARHAPRGRGRLVGAAPVTRPSAARG